MFAEVDRWSWSGTASQFVNPALPSADTCTAMRSKTSPSARAQKDQKLHPCPSTGSTAGACPGYVVDHIVPLKRGGADSPENMQWQTRAEARAKDRVE
jgi:hypothetical protein